jgi:hypothetical protein
VEENMLVSSKERLENWSPELDYIVCFGIGFDALGIEHEGLFIKHVGTIMKRVS